MISRSNRSFGAVRMKKYEDLLGGFVRGSREILGDNLVGIYLHGSAAMGCFHDKRSDIDLLTVIKEPVSGEIKRQYLDMVVRLNALGPAKGIELSVVRENVCSPFVYPTPYEVHFSAMHLDRYRADPEEYIEKMTGVDKDLAAHFTIVYYRGITLYGRKIRDTFSEVGSAEYWNSICGDIENAEEGIFTDPMYMILNLCRVLAYKKDRLILSKQEGGEWGLSHLPAEYAKLISDAMAEYGTGSPMPIDEQSAKAYAGYMLEQIRGK